jgi:hypothetical protein
MVEVTAEVAKNIQLALKKLNYYKGEINGSYDADTVGAYKDFCGIENFEERICEGNAVDRNVLNLLLEKADRV